MLNKCMFIYIYIQILYVEQCVNIYIYIHTYDGFLACIGIEIGDYSEVEWLRDLGELGFGRPPLERTPRQSMCARAHAGAR